MITITDSSVCALIHVIIRGLRSREELVNVELRTVQSIQVSGRRHRDTPICGDIGSDLVSHVVQSIVGNVAREVLESRRALVVSPTIVR